MENYLDKFTTDSEKMKKYIDMVSKYSFSLALVIELTIVILEKSEYIIQYEGWWFRITFALFGLSLITTKRNLKEWIWLGVFGVIGVISYRVTGRNEILRWVVFVWACQGKDMRKVLKFTFWYTAAGCLVIALLSISGIYGAVAQTAVYRVEAWGIPGEIETRYCFGMGHPNSFHGMMLALTWLGIYCYHEKIKWYGYTFIGIAHVGVFWLTDSKTGLLMAMGTIILALVVQYWKTVQKHKWPYLLGIVVIVGAVMLSVLMAVYSIDLPIFEKMDSFLSGRITNLKRDSLRQEGMIHTWSLWSESINNYFFDLGIVRMFYWFGMIPAGIYYIVQCRLVWCGYKKRDYMLLVIVVVITIYSIFEAHFISDYLGRNYIFFLMGMYLKELLGIDQEGISRKAS